MTPCRWCPDRPAVTVVIVEMLANVPGWVECTYLCLGCSANAVRIRMVDDTLRAEGRDVRTRAIVAYLDESEVAA